MNRNDFQTVLALNRFLPNDISRLIIKFKREGEHNDAIIERTELDFHNWLEYDIDVRSYLGSVMMNYQNNILYHNLDYIQNKIHESYLYGISYYDYYNYYERNRYLLNINRYYVRNVPLRNCYLSKWYKTTEKNNLPWRRIHDLIKIRNKIKIFMYDAYLVQNNHIVPYIRETTFTEKIMLMNKIGMIWHYDFFYGHIYLFDSNYQTI